jgi:ABC-type lipoprotein release transport system permease subunit
MVAKQGGKRMNLGRLIFCELYFRGMNFFLGVLSVGVAVACLTATLTFLHKHDMRTDQIVAAKEEVTHAQMEALTDDYRKLTLKMGFNIMILPKDQNLGDLYADDFASKYMPEEYALRLARSRVATLNHILPSLQQKIKWPERERIVLLMGVRGEMYIQSGQQKPLLEAVAPGSMVLGYELAHSLQLKPGDTTAFMGRPFTVAKIKPEQGNKNDITLWISLSEAQAMLGKKGLINSIMALDCTCDTVDRLSHIREEVSKILPDTQIIEFASQALARAEARARAAAEAKGSVQREKEERAKLRGEREAFAAVLIPVVMLGCALWLGFLALANVRQRRTEIGILRALGLRSSQVLVIFLGKAVLVGFTGGITGYFAGRFAGLAWRDAPDLSPVAMAVMDPQLMLLIMVAAPLLTALVSVLPAKIAAKQDPAHVLREE